ncbi:MAG: hypothetical protein A3A33_01150 [Candidatus Yanofskybacteria bacterium RIFCSPLOWO2_01_FULL_49_25]|uniref:N-acetyltransferase domain-containing protein n=1 Tax=Candidatus Yanofskybacteria bacterium RIFCSPLOWO2_01_FULL_49_25 TaxID=1802701 RepID=A0A1F8GXH9_9BACT|nr:MAG: hypothetical protein A3A33_01150 [Candidatus Yanofskybacteria bacterium RIFCSPLOWO2_01_FULL_49_25]
MEGTTIYSGTTKKGIDVVIRYPTADDLDEMLRYINILSAEQTFIRFQGEHVTREFEQEFLTSTLEKISKKDMVYLCTVHEGHIIGMAAIEMRGKIEEHIGDFGISIAKDFRNEGIGTLLMNLVLEEAQKNLPNLKICTLTVFGNNHIARQMYKNMGFREFGILPRGALHKGELIDHVYMYKDLDAWIMDNTIETTPSKKYVLEWRKP